MDFKDTIYGQDVNLLKQIKHDSVLGAPLEACGFIVREEGLSLRAISQPNISDKPDLTFVINPESFISQKNICAIYHSHPASSAEHSAMDKAYCDELQVPFLIYSVLDDKFSILLPDKGSV